MTRLHEGWDYLLYRIYIWGGLAALVVHILVSILVFHVDQQGALAIYVICGPLTLYVFGILLYWWWVFLFKGNKELEESTQRSSKGIPPISALKSWTTLHTAMAIQGGDVYELRKAEKAARRPVLLWYGFMNLMAIWIFGFFWLGWLGFLPAKYFPYMVIGVVAGCCFMIFGIPFLLDRAARSGETAYLAPLGLSLTESPTLRLNGSGGQAVIPKGAAVVEGSRYGRLVHIETIAKHSLTWVQAETPPFKIHSQQGKLVAEKGAPQAVLKALKSLRQAKRWRGIEATGGSEGIRVERESRGQNMWLYDLWLIERLLESFVENRV